MPQIEVPFLPGDKVRVKATGDEGRALNVTIGEGVPIVEVESFGWCYADELEAVKPVIEWKRDDVHKCWGDAPWVAFESGVLWCNWYSVGTFPDPRAVAEETQALWNERAEEVWRSEQGITSATKVGASSGLRGAR